jgi:uncharacterized SAM-binding protein YcdF (DUF218 family)
LLIRVATVHNSGAKTWHGTALPTPGETVRRGVVARPAGWIAGAVGLTLLAFAAGFVMFTRAVAHYAPAPVARADAIVVLTGGELRLVAAARLLVEGRGARLLISGVNRHTSGDDLKRISGLSDRLFACCVDFDFAERTTDNADETRVWATARRFTKLIVVTSSYHMPRSLAELGRVMPEVTLIPHAVISNRLHTTRWWTDAYTARVLLAEYVKFLPSAARYGVARLLRWESSALADGSTARASSM